MEVKFQINYTELIRLIHQLPLAKQIQLKKDLGNIDSNEESNKSTLRELVLNGPKMSLEEHETFKANRKWMNQWKVSEF
ncbi:MAG: hypothetical protein ACK4NY_05895 [Spirosomataceae bacterium]